MRGAICSAILAIALALVTVGGTTAASTLCVGGPQCYPTLIAAVNAAHDGDTIRIGPGTFAGGVTITKSVSLVGAGATRTTIKGGGPVLTIGRFLAPGSNQLAVSISGLTITGGVASTAPTPSGTVAFVAIGGGVYIPGGPSGTVGATVTITDSAIVGNRASPSSTVDSGDPCPGGSDCPFAQAIGGGIADVGRLTLIRTLVSGNVAGGPATSNAGGGGIWTATNSGPGALTLINSSVVNNRASVSSPNGRFAEGGGIEVQDGEQFTVRGSDVSGNTASVSSSFPTGVNMNANSGGIHIGGFGVATIDSTRIIGNTALVEDPSGYPAAFDAALSDGLSDFCACGQKLTLTNSVISGNRTIANVASTDNGPSDSAVEIDGQATVTNTAITDNTTLVTSHTGSAAALGAFFAFDGDTGSIVVTNSVISRNSVIVSTKTGPATIQGVGVTNGGPLELRNTVVGDNRGVVNGRTGSAQGGGIWNGQPFGPDGPTPQLTLSSSQVIRNSLFGNAQTTLQGGGLFTVGFPANVQSTVFARNTPDDCEGC
jgi:hypothetical protein